jgi:hypothetical protein
MNLQRTVAQALVPFPMFGSVDTGNGGGDRIGHSTYHSGTIKVTKHLSHGFTLQGSYVFSKYLTDADSSGPMDPLNRSLEKALSPSDQTHVVKASYTYELPFGKGRQFLNHGGILNEVLGGCPAVCGQNSLRVTSECLNYEAILPLSDIVGVAKHGNRCGINGTPPRVFGIITERL